MDEAVERLMADLDKPMFLYRLAKGRYDPANPDTRMSKGAVTTMQNAAQDIRKAVGRYAEGQL